MRKESIWGMVAVLVFFVSTLSACTVPNIKFPKPELSGVTDSDSNPAFGTQSSKMVMSAMYSMAKVSDTEFVPPLLKLIEISSSCNGCTELREPIKNSLRGAQKLYVELLKTENTIRLSLPTTEKEKRIAAAAEELVKEMKILVAFTLQSLSDADAYERASEEANLSQLSKENDVSLQKTFWKIEKAKREVLGAKGKFISVLN